jgi:hypothetical protein
MLELMGGPGRPEEYAIGMRGGLCRQATGDALCVLFQIAVTCAVIKKSKVVLE